MPRYRRRPTSGPTKRRPRSEGSTRGDVFLPSIGAGSGDELDDLMVPTSTLLEQLSSQDTNRGAANGSGGGGGRRRRGSVVAASDGQVRRLKDKVNFERQFMASQLARAGGAAEPQQQRSSGDAAEDEQSTAQRSAAHAVRMQGKLTKASKENARLRAQVEELQGHQLHVESASVEANQEVQSERLRRINMEGNAKAWEKERRTLLRENRSQRSQIRELESALEAALAGRESQEAQAEALDEQLQAASCEAEVSEGSERWGQQEMEGVGVTASCFAAACRALVDALCLCLLPLCVLACPLPCRTCAARSGAPRWSSRRW
jgi:hypothetical protein